MFQVILREVERITRKPFVPLPPVRKQSIKPIIKVNWYSECYPLLAYTAQRPDHMDAAQPDSEDTKAVASMW